MNQPLISICIPTYNQTIHLKKLLSTIYTQKNINFEVIITDDSTNQEVEDLINETNSNLKSNKIKYTKNTPSLGAPKNWNLGISLAKGEYIKIMHHDGWFEDEFAIKKLLDKIEYKKNTFVFSAVRNDFNDRITNFKISDKNLLDIKNEPEKLILANLIGGPSGILYPNHLNLKFNENIIWLVDVEFYLQLFKKGFSVEYIDQILYTSKVDSDSLTNDNLINSEKQLVEYSFLYNKYIKPFPFLKRIKYIIGIYKILRLPLKKKNQPLQLARFLKRIL
jgi:glycosyltransferase involved in cell wall biosynthesis